MLTLVFILSILAAAEDATGADAEISPSHYLAREIILDCQHDHAHQLQFIMSSYLAIITLLLRSAFKSQAIPLLHVP